MKFRYLFRFAAAALLLVGFSSAAQAAAAANKGAVVGAIEQVIEFVGPECDTSADPIVCDSSVVHTLLTDTFKAPANGDYVFSVTMECFVGSYDIDSTIPYGFGLDYRRAYAQVWIELDGNVIYGNNGKVIFCGQEVLQLYGGEAEDLGIELQRFGGTHGFNWPKLNVPQGNHTVEVKARLGARVLGLDEIPDEGTMVVIGKRTLITEPIKVKIDETVEQEAL